MEKFTMNDTTIAFIGLGLIGGSLAKGIKKARPDIRIMAYMRTRSKLEQAKKDRKSTRLNSSHTDSSRMPSSA